MGFYRQEYWSWLQFPSLGIFPTLVYSLVFASYSGEELASTNTPVTHYTVHWLWHTCERLDQFSSVTQSCLTLCDPMNCSMPDFPVHHKLLELTQTHVHRVGDAIQPSHPLSSPSPAFNVSQHQGLSNESVLPIRWPKYWSFSFSISPSSEYWGLISFRIDWIDLLAVQGILKSLLQCHSLKAPIL